MNSKKVKYFERDLLESNKFIDKSTDGKSKFIDNESNLIMPFNSDNNNKNLFEYEDLDKESYNTPLKISEINIKKQFSNYYGHHIGPGKGFGNLSVSNDIRYGSSTRLDNFEQKINKEKEINNRYDLIDRNFQNPNNLILPFARGGELTRKSLKESSDLEAKQVDLNNSSRFKFNY